MSRPADWKQIWFDKFPLKNGDGKRHFYQGLAWVKRAGPDLQDESWLLMDAVIVRKEAQPKPLDDWEFPRLRTFIENHEPQQLKEALAAEEAEGR